MPSRLAYLREILHPCMWELDEMSARGMRVNMEARQSHDERLSEQQASVKEMIVEHPLVAPHILFRQGTANTDYLTLRAQRDDELQLARQAVMLWRSEHPKEKGGPKLSRKSTLTPLITKARSRAKSAREFNPGSSIQKAWLLYDCFGLPRQYLKESLSTGKRALNHLKRLKAGQPYRDIIEALQEYEHLDQLLTTFIRAEVKKGRIYSAYRIRTGTGRVASGADDDEKSPDADTNAQNWPKELRNIVVPNPGNIFISGDWRQVEWLLMLYLAGDMVNFRKVIEGEDQHCAFASAIFGISYQDLYDAYKSGDVAAIARRQLAKKGRHGLSYGMGPGKMADEMGIPLELASEIVNVDKRLYPLVAVYKENLVKQAKSKRYLETPFGWRRWFLEPHPDVPKILAFMPSSTGADMLKARLPWICQIARSLDGWLLTTTHDSFLLEVPMANRLPAVEGLRKAMEQPFTVLGGLSFPCDVKVGADWKEVS